MLTLLLALSSYSIYFFVHCIANMAAKLLFLYLLAVTGLAVVQVQAGTSTSQPLIHPVNWFLDGIHRIVPLILDRRDDHASASVNYNATITSAPDSSFNGTLHGPGG